MENFVTPNNFVTPSNTLGMSEPNPIDTDVPAGFALGDNLSRLAAYLKKRKQKKLIEYMKKNYVI